MSVPPLIRPSGHSNRVHATPSKPKLPQLSIPSIVTQPQPPTDLLGISDPKKQVRKAYSSGNLLQQLGKLNISSETSPKPPALTNTNTTTGNNGIFLTPQRVPNNNTGLSPKGDLPYFRVKKQSSSSSLNLPFNYPTHSPKQHFVPKLKTSTTEQNNINNNENINIYSNNNNNNYNDYNNNNINDNNNNTLVLPQFHTRHLQSSPKLQIPDYQPPSPANNELAALYTPQPISPLPTPQNQSQQTNDSYNVSNNSKNNNTQEVRHFMGDVDDLDENEWDIVAKNNDIIELGVLGEGAGGSVSRARLTHGKTIFALKVSFILFYFVLFNQIV